MTASLRAKEFLPENDYKLEGAPTLAVDNALKRRPRLFDGCHVYLQGAFPDGGDADHLSKPDLARVLRAGGASLLTREPDPARIGEDDVRVPYHADSGGPLARCSHFLLYREEPLRGYSMPHVRSLPATWVVDCIREFRLVPPPGAESK